MNVCVDLKCSISMSDREFLRKLLLHISIQKITSSILIREIDEKIIKIDDYMIVKLIFHDKLNDVFVKRVIIVEIHIINDFVVNLLLDNDVLCLEKMSFDFN